MASSKNKYYESAAANYQNILEKEGGQSGYDKAVEAGFENGVKQNAITNAEAQKYAGQQARNAAAGAQSQATTAARSAGMNKAQAAMMGSQQNANAYQNAYGNAYSQQLQNANNGIATQQASRQNASGQIVGGYGNIMGAAQQEGQNEYSRKWGNWASGLGIASSLLPTSDERLKNYKECSKKVVYKSPSKLKALKIELKGDK